MFSKSFGYALRGILYIALLHQKEERNIDVDEIAEQLALPRYFMSKVLKNLAKHNLLVSTRGPNGGFSLTDHTLRTPVLNIIEITEGLTAFDNCALRLHKCNQQNPCPLHYQISDVKETLRKTLAHTTISDLLNENNKDFIKSITSLVEAPATH